MLLGQAKFKLDSTALEDVKEKGDSLVLHLQIH